MITPEQPRIPVELDSMGGGDAARQQFINAVKQARLARPLPWATAQYINPCTSTTPPLTTHAIAPATQTHAPELQTTTERYNRTPHARLQGVGQKPVAGSSDIGFSLHEVKQAQSTTMHNMAICTTAAEAQGAAP